MSSVFLLAVGLAMDATTAASARGMAATHLRMRDVALVALLFGGFQAGMPVIGWLVGERFGALVAQWDHWIAFGLLFALGVKMVWESRGELDEVEAEPFQLRVLLVLAVATSIDALAAGLTLPTLDAPIVVSIVIIGVTTAVLSALGLIAGRRFGALLGKKLDLVGGLLLIAVGSKVLYEHLRA